MVRPRERKGRRPVLGERLRAARAARNLSQEQAARELGIPTPTLGHYESGSRRPSALARKYLDAWAATCLGEPFDIIPRNES